MVTLWRQPPFLRGEAQVIFDVTKHPILGIDNEMDAGLINREFNG